LKTIYKRFVKTSGQRNIIDAKPGMQRPAGRRQKHTESLETTQSTGKLIWNMRNEWQSEKQDIPPKRRGC
jgi:hypothetical protein